MREIIERLKKEKLELKQEYHALGKNDGVRWCQDAHYIDIQTFLSWDGMRIPKDDLIFHIIDLAFLDYDLLDYNENPYSNYRRGRDPQQGRYQAPFTGRRR